MAKDVIMPALGMAQETGTLIQWLKAPGETVVKGEPLMEVETDKATVEVEAAASGVLAAVTARPGDVIPVGQRIALLLAPGEAAPESAPVATSAPGPAAPESAPAATSAPGPAAPQFSPAPAARPVSASPVAARMAAEHNLDLAQIKPQGGKVHKEDVAAYLAAHKTEKPDGRVPASPKARRLAQERGLNLRGLQGSGPGGAVLAADVEAYSPPAAEAAAQPEVSAPELEPVSRIWRIMAERVTQAWTTIPHFYLLREVNAARLAAWRNDLQKRAGKITYTDLLVKLTAAALRAHPRLNAAWAGGGIRHNPDINIGLAVAVEDGLLVPVIHRADSLSVSQLAAAREKLVARAQAGRLAPDDLSGGTFTLSNLGMYGVDAFNAIVNPPQAAILAVSRIAERVVAVDGQPAVQPMLTLSLSCDHRVVDGARAAQFLQTLAGLVEEPLRLVE